MGNNFVRKLFHKNENHSFHPLLNNQYSYSVFICPFSANLRQMVISLKSLMVYPLPPCPGLNSKITRNSKALIS